jgi:hypothetical protein
MIGQQKRRRFVSLLLLAAGALVVVLLTQRAMAASIGQFAAQLWVSVLGVVLRLMGAMFGGS